MYLKTPQSLKNPMCTLFGLIMQISTFLCYLFNTNYNKQPIISEVLIFRSLIVPGATSIYYQAFI